MLICKLILKNGLERKFWIRGKKQVLEYDGIDYILDRNKMYRMKLLGFKEVFFIQFVQGNPYPIEYTEKGYIYDRTIIPVSKVARLLNMLKINMYFVIMIVIGVINLLVSLGLYFYISERI